MQQTMNDFKQFRNFLWNLQSLKYQKELTKCISQIMYFKTEGLGQFLRLCFLLMPYYKSLYVMPISKNEFEWPLSVIYIIAIYTVSHV